MNKVTTQASYFFNTIKEESTKILTNNDSRIYSLARFVFPLLVVLGGCYFFRDHPLLKKVITQLKKPLQKISNLMNSSAPIKDDHKEKAERLAASKAKQRSIVGEKRPRNASSAKLIDLSSNPKEIIMNPKQKIVVKKYDDQHRIVEAEVLEKARLEDQDYLPNVFFVKNGQFVINDGRLSGKGTFFINGEDSWKYEGSFGPPEEAPFNGKKTASDFTEEGLFNENLNLFFGRVTMSNSMHQGHIQDNDERSGVLHGLSLDQAKITATESSITIGLFKDGKPTNNSFTFTVLTALFDAELAKLPTTWVPEKVGNHVFGSLRSESGEDQKEEHKGSAYEPFPNRLELVKKPTIITGRDSQGKESSIVLTPI